MNIQLLKDISHLFNAAIAKYELISPENFTYNDLLDTENIITNTPGSNKLTRIFLNNFFPQNDQKEYHHYTTIEAFKSIIESQSIWLMSVSKRFGEKEFRPFYASHGMDGYEKRTNTSGVPLSKELVDDAFYISFTYPNTSEQNNEHLWTAFSRKNGIKLVFEIKNVNTHLRSVYYPANRKNPTIPLLKDFIEVVKSHNRFLIMEGLATIGFFYLPGILENEQEYRLLLKRHKAVARNLTFGKTDEGFEYTALQLFTNDIADIKLIKVVIDNTNESLTRKILNTDQQFSTIIVELK